MIARRTFLKSLIAAPFAPPALVDVLTRPVPIPFDPYNWGWHKDANVYATTYWDTEAEYPFFQDTREAQR